MAFFQLSPCPSKGLCKICANKRSEEKYKDVKSENDVHGCNERRNKVTRTPRFLVNIHSVLVLSVLYPVYPFPRYLVFTWFVSLPPSSCVLFFFHCWWILAFPVMSRTARFRNFFFIEFICSPFSLSLLYFPFSFSLSSYVYPFTAADVINGMWEFLVIPLTL